MSTGSSFTWLHVLLLQRRARVPKRMLSDARYHERVLQYACGWCKLLLLASHAPQRRQERTIVLAVHQLDRQREKLKEKLL